MTRPSASMISIMGVGNMGGGMAERLLRLGYAVAVRDIDAAKEQALVKKGAKTLAAGELINKFAIETIANSSLSIVCVVTAAQARELLLGRSGYAPYMPRGHTVMLCPTMAPGDVQSMAADLLARGIEVIDAPMSGGPARAKDGSMSLMLACSDAVFARHESVLRDLSGKLFRISTRVGDGAKTKLVNNLLAAVNLAGAAEAMHLAEQLGLDLDITLDVIEQSSGQSWIGSDRMRRAVVGDYAPRAHMSLLAKDTQLALQAARACGVQPALGGVAADSFQQALAQGMTELDDAALLKLLQSRACERALNKS
jgi:L-threonate 2-dehydrogenase